MSLIYMQFLFFCVHSVSRSSMVPGFQPFQSGHYSAPGPQQQGGHPPPPPPSQQQQQQQQQQTIVITENPNIRKIRSASTENTMPEGSFSPSFPWIAFSCNVYSSCIIHACICVFPPCVYANGSCFPVNSDFGSVN